MSLSCECCVLSCRGLCVGLIPRPEEVIPIDVVLSVIVKSDSEEALSAQRLSCHQNKILGIFINN
jgi:hypothetical protein